MSAEPQQTTITEENIMEAIAQWSIRKGLLARDEADRASIVLHVKRTKKGRDIGRFYAILETPRRD